MESGRSVFGLGEKKIVFGLHLTSSRKEKPFVFQADLVCISSVYWNIISSSRTLESFTRPVQPGVSSLSESPVQLGS